MLLRPVLSALALSTAVATAAAAEDVDWLLAAHDPAASSHKATLTKGEGGALELSNGLVSRSFITEPNFATVDLRRLDTLYSGGGSFFRALSPEATVRLSHDCGRKSMRACSDGNGTDIMCDQPFCETSHDFTIGGVDGQVHFAQRTNASFRPTVNASTAFRFKSYSTAPISSYPPRFAWTTGDYNSRSKLPWPPRGVRLNVTFEAPTLSPNKLLLAHVRTPAVGNISERKNPPKRRISLESAPCMYPIRIFQSAPVFGSIHDDVFIYHYCIARSRWSTSCTTRCQYSPSGSNFPTRQAKA